MSSSSSKKVERTNQIGHSRRDVLSFINKGNTLASNTGANLNLGAKKNRETKTTTTRRGGTVNPFGILANIINPPERGETKTSLEHSGFLGSFTDKSDEDIEKIMGSFIKRRSLIQQRKRAPGLSQTKLMGS